MKKPYIVRSVAFLAVAVALVGSIPARAQEASKAVVKEFKGEAMILRSGTSDWRPLMKETVLSEGDSVKTAKDSQVQLLLTGTSKTAELTIRPETEFAFKTFNHDPSGRLDTTLLDVQLGGVLVKAEKLVGDSKFEVKTPTSIVGIRGTTFEVQVSKQ